MYQNRESQLLMPQS